MGLLLITHDLGIVAEVADRATVMYAGRVVEECAVATLFENPAHPYSAGLLASVSIEDIPPGARLPEIPGTVPSLLNRPSGCAFAARCSHSSAKAGCFIAAPPVQSLSEEHRVACFAPLSMSRVDDRDLQQYSLPEVIGMAA
jgi:oligopeptide/dipeptide ABC transporter ATP-binding protein